ncbi:MAG: HIRAN domain-containing protein [Oscillospiraceae bacterium]|nr:HIRAN domain-containing protein [Oscillospiraceae bacterium]
MTRERYITITGVKHYYNMKPFKIGKLVKLIKDHDNSYDHEAIAVALDHIDTIGYVANSTDTVYKGTYSAGRIYDKIGETAYAEVMFITHTSVIARVIPGDDLSDTDESGTEDDEIPDYTENEGELPPVCGLMEYSGAENEEDEDSENDSDMPDYTGDEGELKHLAGECLPSDGESEEDDLIMSAGKELPPDDYDYEERIIRLLNK